jgi:pimeloyl-ACP methyl ester carboxylesterase
VPRERVFELPGLKIAAKEWGDDGELPVLAIHGWLDNAASFDRLAPLMPGCHLLAVDCAGHGRSDNRSIDASYNIWTEVGDVLEIADQMGWQTFSLLGHSRGAAVATLVAGTFPERVERVVLLEGAIPIHGEPPQAPNNLAKALTERRQLRRKSGRIFADRQTAILERANGFSKVDVATAEILAERSLRRVDGGYQWHADQRLKAQSEIKLSVDQIAAFIHRIAAPVLLIMAETSPFAGRPEFRELVAQYRDLEQLTLPGRHHFHLEGAEAEIAARASAFLGLVSARRNLR